MFTLSWCDVRIRKNEVQESLQLGNVVLRQNSMRTENSAIPCRDGCPIQVIPSPSSVENLSRGTPSGIPVYIKDGGIGTFSRRYVGSDYAARSYRWCSPPSRT